MALLIQYVDGNIMTLNDGHGHIIETVIYLDNRNVQDQRTEPNHIAVIVTYSRPISYASYPIRVALSLFRFPLRFALTYPRRLSCPLPRPLICQPLAESLVVMNLVDRVLSLAVS